MSDKTIRQAPVFHDAERVAANRERGLVDGSAAIAAVTARKDKRSNDELLLDLLCSLRFWAEESGVSFHEALTGSETHHMVETGKLAENYIDSHYNRLRGDNPANVHEEKEFRFGQRVEVTSGPHWFGATGIIERWSHAIGPFSSSPIPGETSAEIKLDPEWVGKLTGPNITVVLAKLKHLTILEQAPNNGRSPAKKSVRTKPPTP